MASRMDLPSTFFEAGAMMGSRQRLKVGHNTYLQRLSDDEIGIIYHRTAVVRMFRDGSFALQTGGWSTSTTFRRLSGFLIGHGANIGMNKGEPEVFIWDTLLHTSRDTFPFVEGLETWRCLQAKRRPKVA